MKKLAIISLVMIFLMQLPSVSPSKLLPTEWQNNLEFGKRSIQLVLRLYEIQKGNRPDPAAAGGQEQKNSNSAQECPFSTRSHV
jgi:hypothetical protein